MSNDSIEGDLAADQIYEKCDGGPDQLVVEHLLNEVHRFIGRLTFFIGYSTSGRMPMMGLTMSINLTLCDILI